LDALSSGDRVEMSHAMRAYASMNRAAVPRAIFRNVVIAPLIAEIVTLKELEAGVRTSCNGLAKMIDLLVSCAAKRVAEPLADEGLVQATFDEIIDQMTTKLGSQVRECFNVEVFVFFYKKQAVVCDWNSRIFSFQFASGKVFCEEVGE
jgi:hypothetical protein